MEFPKKIKTLCPKCRRHTTHTVKLAKRKPRGSAHPNAKSMRQKERKKRGYGGHGKFSKPATGKKPTQKVDLRLKCEECGKTHTRKGFRVKKFELV
ncbi:MAG: 50S ribosomal protein L44e [Candidatus Aenigmatarchaeota archaeon]|nr:MAG: 50S ribosomal protein L44e [Candidatus Aenigmarchaeota archaeon]